MGNQRIQDLRRRVIDEFQQITTVDPANLDIPFQHLFGYDRLLGEHYCDWIGPVLGFSHSTQLAREFTVATMLLRAYGVISDNIADEREGSLNRYSHVAASLLFAALDRFYAKLDRSDRFLARSRQLLKLSAETDNTEREQHWGSVVDFSNSDMEVMGNKTSVCFIPLAAMCIAADAEPKYDLLCRMIGSRNVAVQLRDDLADWREDLAVGNFTLPLTLALQIHTGKDTSQLDTLLRNSANSILDVLFAWVTTPVLELSDRYIMRCKQIVEGSSDVLTRYFDGLLHANRSARASISITRKELVVSNQLDVTFLLTDGDWPTLTLKMAKGDRNFHAESTNKERVMELLDSLHPRPGLT